MKLVALLFLISACAHVEKTELSSMNELAHEDCRLEREDLRRPLFSQATHGLGTVIGTTGSLALATVGYATDVALIVAPAAILAVACGDNSSGCVRASGDMLNLTASIYADPGFKGFGNASLDSTRAWRCPNVDHISKALRQAANCNAKKGHYSASYAYLAFLEQNETLRDCVSGVERIEAQALRERIKSEAIPQ